MSTCWQHQHALASTVNNKSHNNVNNNDNSNINSTSNINDNMDWLLLYAKAELHFDIQKKAELLLCLLLTFHSWTRVEIKLNIYFGCMLMKWKRSHKIISSGHHGPWPMKPSTSFNRSNKRCQSREEMVRSMTTFILPKALCIIMDCQCLPNLITW